MLALFVAIVVVGCLLLAAEYLSRKFNVHGELTRKFVHMSVGTFAAFWPFFLSWRQIQFLSLLGLVVLLVSARMNVFSAIHNARQAATGEILAAVAVGVTSIVSPRPWVFTAALLTMSLADGLAAIVGLLAGEHNQYKVFGHTRSIAGTMTFLLCSVTILAIYALASHESLPLATLFWLPIAAALLENVAVYGTDNLVVPLAVALVLSNSL